jgi:hypothetical protein
MDLQEYLAPEDNCGTPQMIPTRGPHEQIPIGNHQAAALVLMGLIEYDPDYGPNAKVYRPVNPADAATMRRWIVR